MKDDRDVFYMYIAMIRNKIFLSSICIIHILNNEELVYENFFCYLFNYFIAKTLTFKLPLYPREVVEPVFMQVILVMEISRILLHVVPWLISAAQSCVAAKHKHAVFVNNSRVMIPRRGVVTSM